MAALAQDQPPETNQTVSVMPLVTVKSSRIAPTTGTTIIDKEMIENLPKRDGSINEIIGIVPGVQYSENAFHSFTGGEITPPVVSISGSRFYDNNYTIDGIGNNSTLDPAGRLVNDATSLPGHPQMQFLDSHLIEQITVYNSNIPAEFGGFTGGQIDAKTIEPTDHFWGNINYGTTRSQWTKFHIDPADRNDFYNSTSEDFQPRFLKHDGGFTLNFPIANNSAVVASYQRLYSEIPLTHVAHPTTQTRSLENFFVKLGYQPSNSSRLSLTANYSPSTAKYFLEDFKDSTFKNNSSSYLISLQGEKDLEVGTIKLTLGYNSERNDRDARKNRFFWNPTTPSIDWSSGKTGGLGGLESEQTNISLNSNLAFNSLKLGQTDHLVKLGIEAIHSYKSFERPETNYYYYSPVLYSSSPFTCTSGDPACIAGEQYLSRRTVYPKDDVDAEVNDLAFYFQDAIAWGNLELFPGIRFSYDDFTDDINVAPRFSTSLDLFGDKNTILFAGKNRYYSGTLLTFRLFQSREIINQVRATADNSEGSWTGTSPYTYVDSDLKTPYADESTVGLIQRLLGGELKVQYLHKNVEDEFSRNRNTGPTEYYLNNNGKSEHESFQASWQRSWTDHFFEINATWQKTTTTNIDYKALLSDEDLTETVWYDGEELYLDEIPRIDFNRPYVINLIYIGKLPYHFTFTNTTKIRGPYSRLKNTAQRQQSVIDPSQDVWVFAKQRNKSSIKFNWRLSWEIPSFYAYQAVLAIEVDNVFDRRSPVSYRTDEFEIGRQYWASLEFNF